MEIKKIVTNLLQTTAICILLASCHSSDKDKKKDKDHVAMLTADEESLLKGDHEQMAPKAVKAYAIINPAEGSEVVGVVSFIETEGGVRIVADVAGLTPGLHGFHIHEHGDCGGPGIANAGGHYNPTNKPHGGPDSPIDERHVGDLGNLDANADGIAHYNRVDSIISLTGEQSIIGKSVLVHADPDDLKSQPTGNAGKKIACGVIVQDER